MPKRNIRLFLQDMLDAIEKVERYTAGLTFEEFQTSEIVIGATVRNLEIIGEAARQVPVELRHRHTGVDWRRVVGFRNIVVHAYFDVDLDIVWTIATRQLEALKCTLREILAGQPE